MHKEVQAFQNMFRLQIIGHRKHTYIHAKFLSLLGIKMTKQLGRDATIQTESSGHRNQIRFLHRMETQIQSKHLNKQQTSSKGVLASLYMLH